ncbi:MAG: flagellar hook-length control protein FliK [Phycisphaeraceae bacterium]
MQVFNLGAGNATTREAPAPGRGTRSGDVGDERSATPAPAFREALQQSRQRLARDSRGATDKPATQSDRPATATRDDAPRTDTSSTAQSTGVDSEDAPASRNESEPSAESAERDDGSPGESSAKEALDDATAPTPRNTDAPPADADAAAALADLQATVEQLLEQAQQATATASAGVEGDMAEGPPVDTADPLATALMSALQGEGPAMKPAEGDTAALDRTLRQLLTQTPLPASDRLATLAGLLQAQGQGQGSDPALDLAAVAQPADASAAGVEQKLGQLVNAMPWLAQAAGQGAKGEATGKPSLEAMLAQLATAASANSQASAGGEAVTPAAPSTQTGGQSLGNSLAGGAPGQPMMSEADAQANASRLARAMNSAVNQGSGTLTVRMTPPEMGTVRIQLQMQAGTVNATLHAEGEGARTLLSQQLSQLRQSLEGQGLTVERLSVQSMNGSASSQTQNHSDGSPNEGRSRGEHGGGSGRRQDGQPQDGSSPQRDDAFEQALNEMG